MLVVSGPFRCCGCWGGGGGGEILAVCFELSTGPVLAVPLDTIFDGGGMDDA